MRRFWIAVAVALCIAALPAGALGKGTVRVQKADGSVQVYSNVTISVKHHTLRMMTQDKQGTIVITDGACSLIDAIMRCLPYNFMLEQHGETNALDFDYGTIYYNPTTSKQQLRHSSTQLPADGILGSFRSTRGTYVSVSGTLDSVER
jgi:hypothetical protein